MHAQGEGECSGEHVSLFVTLVCAREKLHVLMCKWCLCFALYYTEYILYDIDTIYNYKNHFSLSLKLQTVDSYMNFLVPYYRSLVYLLTPILKFCSVVRIK
jgi:hypothetical protein